MNNNITTNKNDDNNNDNTMSNSFDDISSGFYPIAEAVLSATTQQQHQL